MKIIGLVSFLVFIDKVVYAEIASTPLEFMEIIPSYNLIISDPNDHLNTGHDASLLAFDINENLQDNLQFAVNSSKNVDLEYACEEINILTILKRENIDWGDEKSLWDYLAGINHSFNMYFSLSMSSTDQAIREKLQIINGKNNTHFQFDNKAIAQWLDSKRYQVQASLDHEKVYTSAILAGKYLYQTYINRKNWSAGIEKKSVTFHPKLTIKQDLWSSIDSNYESVKNKLFITWDNEQHKSIAFDKESLLLASHPLMKDLSPSQLRQYLSKKQLGALLHAKPVVLGHKRRNQWRDDLAPSAYSNWQPTRDKQTIWLSANDGMLHVLDDANGDQLLAYMPAFLASEEVAEGYHHVLNNHDAPGMLMDATPAIYDAYYENQWHTFVAGTAGLGGKGVYALKLGQAIKDTEVLWEFNHPDLGHSASTPIIGKMENGRWAVLVNNGYESLINEASVFIIYLDADLRDGWTPGKDYQRIKMPTQNAIGNGLSALTALSLGNEKDAASFKVNDGVGEINRVYAGDLTGRLWAIDLTSSQPQQWQADLLFKAQQGQSIVHAAEVYAVDENQACGVMGCDKSLLLLFGTGKLLSPSDREGSIQQTFYALRDFMPAEKRVYYRSDLSLRDGKEEELKPSMAGWYFDFYDSTERLESTAKLVSEQIIFQTVKLDMQYCSSRVTTTLYKLPLFADVENNPSNTIDDSLKADYLISRDIGAWSGILGYSNLQGFYQVDAQGQALMPPSLNENRPFEGVLRKAEVYWY